MFGGTAAGDGCGGFVATREGFADAAGGVFGGNAFEAGMSDEETFALGESHGMGGYGADGIEHGAGAADEVMFDGEDGFGSDGEGAFQEEIVDADDRAGKRVFDRSQESVGEAVADGAESGAERGARDGGDGFAEELDGGFFAEGAGLALKGNAHFKDDSTPQCGRSVRRFLQCPGCAGPTHIGMEFENGASQKHVPAASSRGILRRGRRKMKLARPEAGEYAAYYEKYIALVPGNDVAGALETQRMQTMQLFAGRSERDGNFRYAADKWTVKQVLGHVSDSERIFTYRALRIARGDQTPMEGFEQDDYVRSGGFNERPLASLVEEFAYVRSASLALFRSLGAEAAWVRRGTANKNEVSVRALAFITAGHELHHRQILEERYFSAIPRA